MATQMAQPVGTMTVSRRDAKLSVQDYTGSVAYIKTIVPLAAVNIVKHRINFGDENFDTHLLNEVPYVSITPTTPTGSDLYNLYFWLKNAMKSVDKKYVDALFLVIRRRDTKEVIEHYRFNIKYLSNDKEKIPMDESIVFEDTSKIFAQINCLAEQFQLEAKDVSLAMQILLNKHAPISYRTPSFSSKQCYIDSSATGYINFGSVSTPHHKLKILGKGILYEDDASTCTKLSKDKNSEKFAKSKGRDLSACSKDTEIFKASRSDQDLDQASIDCVCAIRHYFKGVPLIQCEICERLSHVPCLGYKSADAVPEPFTCLKCCMSNGQEYQDKSQRRCQPQREYIILTEARLLAYCVLLCDYTLDQVTAKIPKNYINLFLEKMKCLRLVEFKNNEYKLNMSLVKAKVWSHFFHKERDQTVPKRTEKKQPADVPRGKRQKTQK